MIGLQFSSLRILAFLVLAGALATAPVAGAQETAEVPGATEPAPVAEKEEASGLIGKAADFQGKDLEGKPSL